MMKLATSLVLVLGLAASGCSKKKEEGTVQKSDPNAPKVTEPAKQDPPPAAPLTGTALADKYKACELMVSDGKLDEFRKECVADNYTFHATAGMGERKSPDALIEYFKMQKTAFPDWKLQPQLVMVSGRNILAVNLVTGTNTGPMKGEAGEMPATNKKIGMLFMHRLTIDDANKASDEWAWADAGTMMNQLGVAPKGTPPSRPVMETGLPGAPITVVTADDAKEKANIEAVKKSNDAFIANKIADAAGLLTDDAVESELNSPKDTKGKKEIEKSWTAFRNAWTDVKFTDTQAWAANDYVVQTFKFEGKHDKDLGTIKKTGKNVSLDVAEVWHFKDGKVDQLWRFMNGWQLAEQLGLTPAPGAAPAGGAKAPAAPAANEPEKK